jgi:hypothetical protein
MLSAPDSNEQTAGHETSGSRLEIQRWTFVCSFGSKGFGCVCAAKQASQNLFTLIGWVAVLMPKQE